MFLTLSREILVGFSFRDHLICIVSMVQKLQPFSSRSIKAFLLQSMEGVEDVEGTQIHRKHEALRFTLKYAVLEVEHLIVNGNTFCISKCTIALILDRGAVKSSWSEDLGVAGGAVKSSQTCWGTRPFTAL